ncbi:RidA family protein [Phenylobacterium sp.]|uniref:RidA family protein n=1 Tax=Phenylobacterium sp. TaxID=1871053 RepID=UPI002FCA2566
MTLRAIILAAGLTLAPLAASAGDTAVTHFPASPLQDGSPAPYSAAVKAGETVYVAGITDRGGATPTESARRVMDNFKGLVEAAGLTMDELVSVQVFSSNLADYEAFNAVYRTYFKGPMPARAYLGVNQLLGNARFEVTGIAVRRAK